MTEKNLSNIERGLQTPTLNSFLKLIDILKISLAEFGVTEYDTNNKNRDLLVKEIYLSSPKEVETYLNIINSIKNLKK